MAAMYATLSASSYLASRSSRRTGGVGATLLPSDRRTGSDGVDSDAVEVVAGLLADSDDDDDDDDGGTAAAEAIDQRGKGDDGGAAAEARAAAEGEE